MSAHVIVFTGCRCSIVNFNEDWTNEFLMVENRGKGMVCLGCDETLKTLKRANRKIHYKNHASTYSITNEMRRKRIAALV